MERFDANKSTKGASKLRRDLINAEIANLRDLLPLPPSTRQRLSQLQLMALVCVYVRKTNYFQQAFKCQNVNLQSTTPSIGFSKALNGFLMMMTQNGKLLYISDNAAEYLGHSMEDLLIHGDSVYDIIDKQDHSVIQAEMARSASSEDEPRMFMCRINVTRNARRQMRFGDQKVVLVQGHYLSFLPLCSRNEPVFIATCTPIAMPETRECVVQGATNVFTSIHSMDMKFMYLDRIGEYHLGFLWVELQGVSWYKLLHWECMQEAQAKHRLITQSDQDRACILLVRLQRRMGDWIWVHCVLQVKDSVENNQHPVIVCTNQILSDREAMVMKSNSWLYEYYMVQSKLQYSLTYSGAQQNAPIPRIAPYYHHQHSPQPVSHHSLNLHQPVHVQEQAQQSLPTPPGVIEIPHASVTELQPTTSGVVAANVTGHHPTEKLEPVDYSLHQSTSHYHVCPSVGRCYSSSSTGDDSLDTFARQHIDDSVGYVHQYRSIVTVTQCNPNSYPADNPDLYSYQLIGSEPTTHSHQHSHLNENLNLYSPYGHSKYNIEENDLNNLRRHQDEPRYTTKAKSKKTSGSIPSTITSVPQAHTDRDHFHEDDDVFVSQWKSQHTSESQTATIDYQNNQKPVSVGLDKSEEHKHHAYQDDNSEMIDINQLGFQHKRKQLMPMSKNDSRDSNSPHWTTTNSTGIVSEWPDPATLYQPNMYATFDSVRPPLVCTAKKETMRCYWKHLENYSKVHLDMSSDKYTLCNIDNNTKPNDYYDGLHHPGVTDGRFHHCNSTAYVHCPDQWIYPLHPPLPAMIDCSPLSSYPSSSSDSTSPASISANYMQYLMPADMFSKNSSMVEDVIV